MSKVNKWQVISHSVSDTLEIASQIGKNLKGGEVIQMISDLGGGKTTFTRGLVKGAGSKERVSSPTFVLRNEYPIGDLVIYHYDFYRIKEPGIIINELNEVFADPRAVSIIEWPEIIESVLPKSHLTIVIENIGETERLFSFCFDTSIDYLLKEIRI